MPRESLELKLVLSGSAIFCPARPCPVIPVLSGVFPAKKPSKADPETVNASIATRAKAAK
jgi:hypothetical protein